VYSQAPKQDIVLMGGDFNAKIGGGAPVGKFGLGVKNDNGERLVQFAQTNGLLATKAMVRQHLRHQYTWCAPGGACRNQIDYILMQDRFKSSVTKCKSCPSADADTDHTLVRLKFKLKLHKIRKSKAQPRFDFSQEERFQLDLRNRFQLLDTPDAADPSNCVDANAQ